VHQLRDRIIELFGDTHSSVRLQTQVMSFGYKFGLPLDVDMVLDCRFLPNPHWVPELRPMSGRDDAVRDFVLGQDLTEDFLQHLRSMLADLLPAYAAEGKAYLTVAFGCTGGRHRSVAIAERMAAELGDLGYPPSVRHRDIDR
jgi:RNase adapter protein RapZ